jgi:hypothetical protein
MIERKKWDRKLKKNSMLYLTLVDQQINTKALTLKAKIKMHCSSTPIRSVIMKNNSPFYKSSAHIRHNIKEITLKNYGFNVINCTIFLEGIRKLRMTECNIYKLH